MKQEMLAKISEAQKKIQDLKVSIADYPYDDDSSGPDIDDLMDFFNSQIRWVNQDIQSLYQMMYQHLQGHLPAIDGAARMQKALDVLGLAGDYDVQKKTIYANNGQPAKWIVEMTPKTKP